MRPQSISSGTSSQCTISSVTMLDIESMMWGKLSGYIQKSVRRWSRYNWTRQTTIRSMTNPHQTSSTRSLPC
eukprot:6490238-Amphidinium_carterae.1